MAYIRTKYKKMPKPTTRTYSRYTREVSALLGGLIRAARKERKLTAQELADRAGISRGLLQRIEKGNLKCEIGAVFEVATIVGVKLFDTDETTLEGMKVKSLQKRLFDADERTLARHLRQTEDKLTLLPQRIRTRKKAIRDDF